MTLTYDELIFGYWPARQRRQEIPPPLRDPGEYRGGSVLNLACTQTALRASEQQALVAAWCGILPTLPIKILVFSSKVSQRLFEAACCIRHLEALSIKWSSIASLEPLAQCVSLRALFLGSSPAIARLEPLAACAGLEHLFVENVRQPVDLSFLGELTQLREFGVSATRGKRLKVRSLQPIAALRQLELLWLVDLQILEDGLKPLHSLDRLASLRTTMKSAGSTEFKELCAAVPTLKYFQPVG